MPKRYCLRHPDGHLDYFTTKEEVIRYVYNLHYQEYKTRFDITDCKTGEQVEVPKRNT